MERMNSGTDSPFNMAQRDVRMVGARNRKLLISGHRGVSSTDRVLNCNGKVDGQGLSTPGNENSGG